MKEFQLTECIHGAWLVECEDHPTGSVESRLNGEMRDGKGSAREPLHRIGVRNLSEQDKCQWRNDLGGLLSVRRQRLPSGDDCLSEHSHCHPTFHPVSLALGQLSCFALSR